MPDSQCSESDRSFALKSEGDNIFPGHGRKKMIEIKLADLRSMLLECLVDYSPLQTLDEICRYDFHVKGKRRKICTDISAK